MITSLWTAGLGWVTKNTVMAALIATTIGLIFSWDYTRINAAEKRGEDRKQQQQVKSNDKAKKKIRKARNRVSSAGSTQRLRKQWCRDC